MPSLNFHFLGGVGVDAIPTTRTESAVGILKPNTTRAARWKLKYVGWTSTNASLLRVTLPTLNQHGGTIQSFNLTTSHPTAAALHSAPHFTFVATGQEMNAMTTISLYGSVAMDLDLGTIQLFGNEFHCLVEGFDSSMVRQAVRHASVILEYDDAA